MVEFKDCLQLGLSTLLGMVFKPLKLEHYQRRTIAIETGIQNVQVASGIILLTNFSQEEFGEVILHPFLYFVGQVNHEFVQKVKFS